MPPRRKRSETQEEKDKRKAMKLRMRAAADSISVPNSARGQPSQSSARETDSVAEAKSKKKKKKKKTQDSSDPDQDKAAFGEDSDAYLLAEDDNTSVADRQSMDIKQEDQDLSGQLRTEEMYKSNSLAETPIVRRMTTLFRAEDVDAVALELFKELQIPLIRDPHVVDQVISKGLESTREQVRALRDANRPVTDAEVEMAFDKSAALASVNVEELSECYTYDICVVLDFRNRLKDRAAKQYTMLMNALKEANLRSLVYQSENEKGIAFLLIGAAEDRLRQEAARIGYQLLLDPAGLLKLGKQRDMWLMRMVASEEAWAEEFSEERTLGGMYGAYMDDPHLKEAYLKRDLGPNHSESVFTEVDRIKLTMSIVSADPMNGGAGFSLEHLATRKQHLVDGVFPLHHESTRNALYEKWLGSESSMIKWWRQPMNDIRAYFGEEIALYFGFLQFYNKALLGPAFFGTAVFLYQAIEDQVDVAAAPVFALVMAFWATLFTEFWKRKEAAYRVAWGMVEFDDTPIKQAVRPTYEGILNFSPVTGLPEPAEPITGRVRRQCMSNTAALTLLAAVIASVIGIFIFRTLLLNQVELPFQFGSGVTAALTAVQIVIMNWVYEGVSTRLNDYENHRTNEEYENALIAKNFIFKFINSYCTLFYLGFLRQWDPFADDCADGTCLEDLQIQLASIFITLMLISNAFEFWPLLRTWWTARKVNEERLKARAERRAAQIKAQRKQAKLEAERRKEEEEIKRLREEVEFAHGTRRKMDRYERKKEREREEQEALEVAKEELRKERMALKETLADAVADLSIASENQFALEQYEGVFSDYDELIVQFGFVTLFIVAFPAAPLLALMNNFLEVVLDARKMLNFTRRPQPVGVQSIGQWHACLEVLGFLSVVTNLGLVISNLNVVEDIGFESTAKKWLFFVTVEHGLMTIKFLLMWLIPDVPGKYQTQYDRQRYVTDILIKGHPVEQGGLDGRDIETVREKMAPEVTSRSFRTGASDEREIAQRMLRQGLSSGGGVGLGDVSNDDLTKLHGRRMSLDMEDRLANPHHRRRRSSVASAAANTRRRSRRHSRGRSLDYAAMLKREEEQKQRAKAPPKPDSRVTLMQMEKVASYLAQNGEVFRTITEDHARRTGSFPWLFMGHEHHDYFVYLLDAFEEEYERMLMREHTMAEESRVGQKKSKEPSRKK